jgi:hypothetical protein
VVAFLISRVIEDIFSDLFCLVYFCLVLIKNYRGHKPRVPFYKPPRGLWLAYPLRCRGY